MASRYGKGHDSNRVPWYSKQLDGYRVVGIGSKSTAVDLLERMVEAVGIEPTSEKRVPKVSTHIAFTYGHRPCAMQKAAYASASSDLTIPLRSGTNLSVQSTLASPQPVPWTMAHGWNVTVN